MPEAIIAEQYDITPAMLARIVELLGTQAEREHAAERRGYRRGYEDGRADASLFNAQLYEREQALQHWKDRRAELLRLSRDDRFIAKAREAKFKTWEQRMALALRGGMLIEIEPDMHPLGVR